MLVAGVVEWAGVDEQVLEEGELKVKLPGAHARRPVARRVKEGHAQLDHFQQVHVALD